MTHVGSQCIILKVSPELKSEIQRLGSNQRFLPDQVLFREDDNNSGVFLVLSGKVCMSVNGLPNLDRLFTAGSLLGLPSTFTGHTYCLTAVAVTEAEAIRVAQEDFVSLMRAQPELCREATEILGREVTFIQSALAERRKQVTSKKLSLDEVLASS
ncbi:MAG: Crp/Fnr family transcriptional regulator [Candidatus Korobacteraceae bacterium]